jgi:hypothetical protein
MKSYEFDARQDGSGKNYPSGRRLLILISSKGARQSKRGIDSSGKEAIIGVEKASLSPASIGNAAPR